MSSLSLLILVNRVFLLFFPWSTWLEVYQLYWSFQRIAFNFIDLSLFFEFYWFLLFIMSLPLLALVLIWSLLLTFINGILDYWLKNLLVFQYKHLMLYIFLLATVFNVKNELASCLGWIDRFLNASWQCLHVLSWIDQ